MLRRYPCLLKTLLCNYLIFETDCLVISNEINLSFLELFLFWFLISIDQRFIVLWFQIILIYIKMTHYTICTSYLYEADNDIFIKRSIRNNLFVITNKSKVVYNRPPTSAYVGALNLAVVDMTISVCRAVFSVFLLMHLSRVKFILITFR